MVSASATSRFATLPYFRSADMSRPPLEADRQIGVGPPEAAITLTDRQTQAQCVLRQALVVTAGDDAHRNERWKHQKQQPDAKRWTCEQRPDGRNQHAAADHQKWHERYAPQHRWSRAALEDGI